MDYWPSYIPKPSSLSESVDDPYIEATSETGDDAARVRYSKERQGPTKLTWKIMRLGDFVALKQFYAEHRAIEFLWLHPSRGLTYKTRFVSSPISSSEDGKSPFVAQVEVTLQIVELAPTEQEQPSVDDLMATVNAGADRAVQAAVDAGQARDAAQESARQAAASAKEAADTAAEIPAAVEAGKKTLQDEAQTQIESVKAAGTEQVAEVKAEGQTQTAAAKAQADAAAASAQEAADRLNEFKDLGATAETLAAGSDATASFDASTGVLTIGVPKGDKGDKGDPGAKGELATDNVTIVADISGNAVAQDIAIGGDASDLASARGFFYDKYVPWYAGTPAATYEVTDFNDFTRPGRYHIRWREGSPASTGEEVTANNPNLGNGIGAWFDAILEIDGVSASSSVTSNARTVQRIIVTNATNSQTNRIASRLHAGTTWYPWKVTTLDSDFGDGLRITNFKVSVPEYEGATASSAGISGLVPPAAAGEEDFVLHGDGTYRSVTHSSDEISAPVYWFGFPANERTEDITADTLLTVPRYQVGSNSLFVFIDNGLCTKGETYEEVGEDATVSTQIKLLTTLKPYHELKGYVISTIVSDKDPSAVQRIAALESQIDSVIPLPVGFVAVYAGTDEPLGWRRLDGQTITGVSSVFPAFKAWAVDDGHAVLCTLDEYETELSMYEGQCGKFGWDEDTDTLRLPTISAYIRGTTSVSEIGTAMQSGLPNATGQANIATNKVSLGTQGHEGVFSPIDNANILQGSSDITTGTYGIKLDLSVASPIFGRSPNSVTPPSVRYPYIIKVADAVYPPSVMDARKMATLVSSLRDDVPGMAAKAAGPSVSDATNIEISVPSSGTEWPAPADGYIRIMANATADYGWVRIRDNGTAIHNMSAPVGYELTYTIRASRGSVYKIEYENVTNINIKFLYANGNAPA